MRSPHYWQLHDRMNERQKRRARLIADSILARAIGSVRSTHSSARVAITFDDGPDPDVTPRLLEHLASLDAKCTFFLLTAQGRRHPELVRSIQDAGHEIGLHGNDHRRITRRPYSHAVRYLREARQELEQLAGTRVEIYRPPYGAQSLTSYLAARKAGLNVVVWSADAADWTDRPVEEVAADGLRSLTPGGILLLHERLEPDPGRGAPATAFDRIKLTQLIIEGVRARGWEPVTVGESIQLDGARRTAWFRP